MRRLAALAALALGAGLVATGMNSTADAADTASVSVVHGIPDTPVDVLLDGKPILPNFRPGTIAGPLQVPAGTHRVTIFPAGKDSGPPVISASADVTAGANISLVAHLSAGGSPVLSPYVNDMSMLDPGQTRLVVRHTAAAPAVDVRAGGKPVITGLTNPNGKQLDLPTGTVSADVVLAGTSTVVIGPADLDLPAGKETIVYAIGSAKQKNLSLLTQSISDLGSAPSGMPAGSGGLRSDGGFPAWGTATTIAGAALILGSATVLARARARG